MRERVDVLHRGFPREPYDMAALSGRRAGLNPTDSDCYHMAPRPVSVRNNPHQILDTMRQTFNGDLFER